MATFAAPAHSAAIETQLTAANGPLTLAQYLRTSYSPDCDFVENYLEGRHVGTFLHGKTQLWIGSFLLSKSKEWNIEPIPEQRIQVTNNRVRVCDLAVLRRDLLPESVTVTPPLLCIEILSPEDRIARARIVLADYLAMGVPECWLIDPVRREAFILNLEGWRAVDEGALELPNSPVRLDLAELFAALD